MAADLVKWTTDNIIPAPSAFEWTAPEVPLRTWIGAYALAELGAYRSRHTVRAKQRDLADFLAAFQSPKLEGFVERPIGFWARPVTVAYLRRYERNPATAARRLATLRKLAAFILARERRALPQGDPVEAIKWPRPAEPDWKGLSDQQVRRLQVAALDRIGLRARRATGRRPGREHRHAVRDRALLEVLLGTALRVGELIGLELDHYRGHHLRDVLRKGASVQTIYVPARAREALEHYLVPRGPLEGPLFLSAQGTRITQVTVGRALRAIAAAAGPPAIGIHPHLLRHTALRQISRRASLQSAIRLAGHSESSGAKYIWRYTKASREELEQDQEQALTWQEETAPPGRTPRVGVALARRR